MPVRRRPSPAAPEPGDRGARTEVPMERSRSGRPRAAVVAVVSILVPVLFAPAARGADDAGAPELARQLEGIRAELHGIAELLATVERHQEVMTLMTRIRLKQQGLASREADLRNAQSELENLEQQLEMLAGLERSWSDERTDGLVEAEAESVRQQRELVRQRTESLEGRKKVLDMRVVELENELARARDDVAALEEIVDDRLGLR